MDTMRLGWRGRRPSIPSPSARPRYNGVEKIPRVPRNWLQHVVIGLPAKKEAGFLPLQRLILPGTFLSDVGCFHTPLDTAGSTTSSARIGCGRIA